MKISTGIRYCEPGMRSSIRAMQVSNELLSITNDNVAGFDKVGYQRKQAVVSSFTEFLGVHGISTNVDEKVGRIQASERPLDIALANEGYFQIQTKDGVKLTRDGRFKLDKDGSLLSLEEGKVLSDSGVPIKMPFVPDDVKEIQVDRKGRVSILNKNTRKLNYVATLGVVDSRGMAVMRPDVKQGYNEYSNVSLQNEFLAVMPTIRAFEANRQIFIMQNTNVQKAISQLGSAS
jgi:flagellar basal-body rod protein FlgF